MRRHSFLKIALSSMALTGLGCNQANGQGWAKEPTAVFGVVLGQLVKEITVPSCPAPGAPPRGMCVSSWGPATVDFRYAPELHPQTSYSVYATILEERVADVTLLFHHDSYERILEVIEYRFGPPTRRSSRALQTRGGATLTSEALNWDGENVDLTVIEHLSRIDESAAIFGHRGLIHAKRELDKAKARAGAAKF